MTDRAAYLFLTALAILAALVVLLLYRQLPDVPSAPVPAVRWEPAPPPTWRV